MKTTTLVTSFWAIAISASLGGCAIGLSGSASLSADGSTAILKGPSPLEVKAKQPELPPPPPEPKKAKIVEERIEITEKVMFAYDKAEILSESFDLLNDVAQVMKEHPEVAKIRIEGHTDSDGTNKYNKDLSNRRAKAVMEYILKAGVDESRMVSEGFGEDRPIASNDTDEGKAQNRRVEFNIIERTGKTPPDESSSEIEEISDEE
jgi:OOP family OmpA-OmpF porin